MALSRSDAARGTSSKLPSTFRQKRGMRRLYHGSERKIKGVHSARRHATFSGNECSILRERVGPQMRLDTTAVHAVDHHRSEDPRLPAALRLTAAMIGEVLAGLPRDRPGRARPSRPHSRRLPVVYAAATTCNVYDCVAHARGTATGVLAQHSSVLVVLLGSTSSAGAMTSHLLDRDQSGLACASRQHALGAMEPRVALKLRIVRPPSRTRIGSGVPEPCSRCGSTDHRPCPRRLQPARVCLWDRGDEVPLRKASVERSGAFGELGSA